MGKPKEALHTFLKELESAPKASKERAKKGSLFTYRTTIVTERFDPGVGRIEVRGPLDPWFGDPVVYSAPDLGLSEAAFFGRQRELSLNKALHLFTAELEGHEVEVDTSLQDSTDLVPSGFWDNWKDSMLGHVYREEVYPPVLRQIRGRSSEFLDKGIVAVDLFGGDGEFAESMLGVFRQQGQKPKVHVVDANERSLEIALKRAAVDQERSIVVHPPIDLTTAEDIFLGIDTSPDVVTILGGLCESVVSREDGLRIAEKVFAGMEANSLFIVSGYTALRLNAADFINIGFTVLQMSIPQNALSFTTPYQLYVLRK